MCLKQARYGTHPESLEIWLAWKERGGTFLAVRGLAILLSARGIVILLIATLFKRRRQKAQLCLHGSCNSAFCTESSIIIARRLRAES